MADCQSETVNARLQGADVAILEDDNRLHQELFDNFIGFVAMLRALNGDHTQAADETRDTVSSQAREAFDDLMECPAGALASILLKLKGAQLWAFNAMEGSCVSPRVYGELLGIIAADLEVVMDLRPEMRGAVGLLHTVDGGKAVLS